MYFIDVKSAKVYILGRENSWQPSYCAKVSPNYPPTMVKPGPALLTMKKKYLYTRNHLGIFVRINLTEKMIADSTK